MATCHFTNHWVLPSYILGGLAKQTTLQALTAHSFQDDNRSTNATTIFRVPFKSDHFCLPRFLVTYQLAFRPTLVLPLLHHITTFAIDRFGKLLLDRNAFVRLQLEPCPNDLHLVVPSITQPITVTRLGTTWWFGGHTIQVLTKWSWINLRFTFSLFTSGLLLLLTNEKKEINIIMQQS